MWYKKDLIYDVIGVGIGPSNLSLAALLEPFTACKSHFFDENEEFNWHPGLLFEDADIQVSFIKDLVTLTDPTSKYSFISFLFHENRLYEHLNCKFSRIKRWEFNQYLQWVSKSLSNLSFSKKVNSVTFNNNLFEVHVKDDIVKTKNIVIGTGLVPNVPACAESFLGEAVFHSSKFLFRNKNLSNKEVVIIGGGQSGAEIFNYILDRRQEYNNKVTWVTSRHNFLPLDDSPFTNELFTPAYSDYFFSLPTTLKKRLLREQNLASDGISEEILEKIYRHLYEAKFRDDRTLYSHHANLKLIDIEKLNNKMVLKFKSLLDSKAYTITTDLVILCTGYRANKTNFLDNLQPKIIKDLEGEYFFNSDYSINWHGPSSRRIYVQNAAKFSRGIAEPNLSLTARRSAIIINSIVGKKIYRDHDTVERKKQLEFEYV